MQRFQSAHDVLASVRKKLESAASAPAMRGRESVLEHVTDILSQGRGYSWIGIYLSVEGPPGAVDSGSVAQAESRSTMPHVGQLSDAGSEMVVPIRVGTRTLGMINVEGARGGRLSRQERTLLGQVAAALAKYLTTGPGKLQRRQARAQVATTNPGRPHKGPQPARLEKTRAVAGEHSTR
jgi:putative methionine-R-sulfoxide reductase with GAF domain